MTQDEICRKAYEFLKSLHPTERGYFMHHNNGIAVPSQQSLFDNPENIKPSKSVIVFPEEVVSWMMSALHTAEGKANQLEKKCAYLQRKIDESQELLNHLTENM
jgi:hypothetical protein